GAQGGKAETDGERRKVGLRVFVALLLAPLALLALLLVLVGNPFNSFQREGEFDFGRVVGFAADHDGGQLLQVDVLDVLFRDASEPWVAEVYRWRQSVFHGFSL